LGPLRLGELGDGDVIVAAVFPIYYYKVAGAGLPPGEATRRYAICTAAALAAIAVLGPFLGTLADVSGRRRSSSPHS
jgi:UMF1 family MFS transporter